MAKAPPYEESRRRREGRKQLARHWVYVGTSTGGGSLGIYRFTFFATTGQAAGVEFAAEAANPTFLSVHPGRRFLYAVNAVGEFQGQKSGAVSAFGLDPASGELSLLNQQPSGGAGPCHVTLDAAGRHALVANYGGGSVASLPIGDDGTLKPPVSVIQHHGSSVNPRRQEGPHAHSINLDADNRFAFAADLGVDEVRVYRFDAGTGSLSPHEPAAARLAPGAGPRHLAFHPSGRFAYVINELDSTLTAFSYDRVAGRLSALQTVNTLPAEFAGENYPSEVAVHPTGSFVYGSNRGHDSIAFFAVDPGTGALRPSGHAPSGGRCPRHFAIDPSGGWMIVGNQNSDNVVLFRIDVETGALLPTGQELDAPAPICFRFVPAE